MAEALGVAASIVQIVDAVSKLKNLWYNIKNAPEDLTDHIEDIQRTAKLLDRSKQLFSTAANINDECLTECTLHLEQVLNAMQSLSNDLQKALNSNKRLGCLEIVLKKDEIARGMRRLERARLLLSHAQQNLSL